jgi:LexA-binding, inner membrane-associated putative hydrolase
MGHALAGVAAAWLSGARLTRRHAEIALFGAAAIAPDLDLLFGTHSTYSHSIGAVALAFLLTLAVMGGKHWRIALGVAAAWSSHIALDWLGSDTSPPIGIMALWPFDDGYYQSSLAIFDAISRRYWLPDQFVWGNLRAALKEIVVLAPITGVAFWRRTRRG